MGLVPNIPTDYTKLDPVRADDARLLASKSGKTPWDAQLLYQLARIAAALEAAHA